MGGAISCITILQITNITLSTAHDAKADEFDTIYVVCFIS
jgi:hypothetical protein